MPQETFAHLCLPFSGPLPPGLRDRHVSVQVLICDILFGRPPLRGSKYDAGDESDGNPALAAAVASPAHVVPADLQVCAHRMGPAAWDVLVLVPFAFLFVCKMY